MQIHHYLTTGEAAQLLTEQLKQKVSYYDLDNLLRSGSIPDPNKIGGRRVWSPKDIQGAARALRIRRAKRPVLTLTRSTVNYPKEQPSD
ncbi:MAG: hypothetical protein ABJK11_14880 [Balneola sp.]